ncbi:MAG: hypothetical protein FRX49_02117 [Trebouxia sp. A1-2]|nr:MAG: hypothetical protein FRX49_02117 [Trebouxia sp. A1-2]
MGKTAAGRREQEEECNFTKHLPARAHTDVSARERVCVMLQLQGEVWRAGDFPRDSPAGCGLTAEQYRDLIDSRLGTPIASPWGTGIYLSATEWKQHLIDLYSMNWL